MQEKKVGSGIAADGDVSAGEGADVTGRDVTEQHVNVGAAPSRDIGYALGKTDATMESIAGTLDRHSGWLVDVQRQLTEHVQDDIRADTHAEHFENQTDIALAQLSGKVESHDMALNGNGSLGTVRWERITRGLAVLAIILFVALLAVSVVLSLQISQNSQQISALVQQMALVIEALP